MMSKFDIVEFKHRRERRENVFMNTALAAFMSAIAFMELLAPIAGLIPVLAFAVFALTY